MKRLMILVISGLFAFALTACGESGTKPEKTEVKVEQTTVKPADEVKVEETKSGTDQPSTDNQGQ